MKSAEAPNATKQHPASIPLDNTTRTLMVGVHWLAKVWIEVMIDSTAPYRFKALWLMILSKNSTIRIGPKQPVDCFTAAIAPVPSGVASTATAPKVNERMVPRVAPRYVEKNGRAIPISAGR